MNCKNARCKLGIGSTIWRFDESHRIYYKDRDGGPDYRSFWCECRITGETSRSWIIGNWGKCPKNGEHYGWALTAQEVDDDVWAKYERHRIVMCVERCDVATLRRVALIVGYMPNDALSGGEVVHSNGVVGKEGK